jgi:hypothetical protein
MLKKIIFLLIVIFGINFIANAQEDTSLVNSRKLLKKAIKEKLVEKLKIDDETANKFIKLASEEKKTIEEYTKEKKNIAKYLEDNSDAPDVMDKINDLLAIDDKINKSRKDFVEELKKILTPQQIAKALIFQKNLRKMFYKDHGR